MEKDNMDRSRNDSKPMTAEVREVESDGIYIGIKHVEENMKELVLQHHMGLEDLQTASMAVTAVRSAYFSVDLDPQDRKGHWENTMEAARYFVDKAEDRFKEWPSVMYQLVYLELLIAQIDGHRKTWYSGGEKE